MHASAPRQGDAASADWLTEINRYRQAAGLAAVQDQPSWDPGLAHHITYLERTPEQYFTGQWSSPHTENPSSPYYTADGAREGWWSDLDEGGASTPLQAVDQWLAAPFHAVGMLRAQLTRVALADDEPAGYAALDVLQGVDANQPPAQGPILFPGPGIVTDLLTYQGESPDPLETCGWQGVGPVGLPLILLLPQPPSGALTATLSGPDGIESTASGDLCVVDENTWQSSDPLAGPAGASALHADRDVFLIPRRPLVNGTYSVSVQQPSQADIDWSFTARLTAPAALAPPSIAGAPRTGDTLRVAFGSWTENPTALLHGWLRCDAAGANCNGITGANGTSLILTPRDVGHTIRVAEDATNAAGPGIPAYSGPTARVAAAPPPARTEIRSVLVRGHDASIVISSAPGTKLRCALSPSVRGRFAPSRFVACRSPVTYTRLAAGRYLFTVISAQGEQSRQFQVR